MTKFQSIEECKVYLRSKQLKKGVFFQNQIRGNFFYTLEPTIFVDHDSITGYQQKLKVNVNCKKVNYLNNCGKHFKNEHMKKRVLSFMNNKSNITMSITC